MWLDLQKPGTIPQELIPIIAWHESHTLALSRHTNERATNSQVCFHWHHFCGPVNPLWSVQCHWGAPSIKATLAVKLLPVTVSTLQVNCGCLCTSVDTQWLLFQSIVWNVHPLRHQGTTASWIFKKGISQNTNYVIVSGFHKSGHILSFRGFYTYVRN